MASVRVVTDSTADLPLQLANENGISIVPLNVHFGNDVFKDQTELDSDAFFQKLLINKNHPRTSQPSPGDFAEVYRAIAEAGKATVSLHLSGRLSGTVQSALIAAEALGKDVQVSVIDTKMGSMALGLRVLEAARAANSGATYEEVSQIAQRSLTRSGVFFAVDTLDYLYANGRIGKATHLVGSLLNMKPILTLQDGVVTPYEKVRGRQKVMGRLAEILGERVPKETPVWVSVVHGRAQDMALAISGEISKRFNVQEMIVTSLGAVIGTHVGPGTIAVAYLIPE